MSEFDIGAHDLVLDVGCGAQPVPLATHLADRSLHDHRERFDRQIPLGGRPFIECDVQALPFADKAFDFVYCVQVLEHVADPNAACRELMRVAKRGYLECPRSWFEFVLGSPHHRWLVDLECDTLIFREKLAAEDGDVLGLKRMVFSRLGDPAFARRLDAPSARALANVELYWEGGFRVHVIRKAERLGRGGSVCDPSIHPRGSTDETLRQRLTRELRSKLR
jgi:SAM-dependent methyltransferase